MFCQEEVSKLEGILKNCRESSIPVDTELLQGMGPQIEKLLKRLKALKRAPNPKPNPKSNPNATSMQGS